jgi:methyl acetate hydrolase
VCAIFSCTKAIAGAALMQLVEEGAVRLDDPVVKYVPEINDIQVLVGFAKDGSPQLEAPRTQPTVGQLMLHTAGFGYEFFSYEDLRYRQSRGIPSIIECRFESVQSVLLFEPGERWNYGVNIDWVGKVVEAAPAKWLGEACRERIFDPLGMVDIGFEMTPSMAERRATIHQRAQDGTLTPHPTSFSRSLPRWIWAVTHLCLYGRVHEVHPDDP